MSKLLSSEERAALRNWQSVITGKPIPGAKVPHQTLLEVAILTLRALDDLEALRTAARQAYDLISVPVGWQNWRECKDVLKCAIEGDGE